MPVVQTYKDLNQYYFSTERKILLNRLNYHNTDPNELSKLLYTVYEDEITIVPQCSCGNYQGAYLLGKVCPKCNTTVVSPFEQIRPIFWIEKYMTYKAL